ncbi:hypothetical protein BLS_001263 [Venturia inaequalis]|uniref:Uncharacterized protein n=1 Tax=Venturia inaequalis TaxID=5025 RepID=A0A8H3YLB8_VENIN|nr:hypothetical protein BLS_001263 [Venturia inaequalis]
MMNLTTPPFEKHIVRGPMDLYVQRRTTPSSGGRGLDTTLVHSVHGESKENGVSRSGWVAINAKARGEGEGGYYEDGDGDEDEDEDEGGYDMDIDFDNPSANEDEYPSEDFEEEIRYYTHQNDSLAHPTTNAPPEEKEEEGEEEELDGHPHHILKIYGSHDHIILTASKTSPLLTPHERTLLTQIKSRKDEATLGFPSGSHSYHAYLGPSILRNATLERLGLFLNGPELEKIKIGVAGYPNRKDWKRIKARTLWRTLYVRAIREREIDTILRDVEKQEKEREEVRLDGERSIGVKSSLFAAYNVQSVEGEEEISWDDLLKAELEMKTDGMSPGERREWLSGVYGARWTWAITEITTEQRLESLSDENNLKVHFTQGKFAEGVVQLGLESRADAMGLLGNGNFTWKNTRASGFRRYPPAKKPTIMQEAFLRAILLLLLFIYRIGTEPFRHLQPGKSVAMQKSDSDLKSAVRKVKDNPGPENREYLRVCKSTRKRLVKLKDMVSFREYLQEITTNSKGLFAMARWEKDFGVMRAPIRMEDLVQDRLVDSGELSREHLEREDNDSDDGYCQIDICTELEAKIDCLHAQFFSSPDPAIHQTSMDETKRQFV